MALNIHLINEGILTGLAEDNQIDEVAELMERVGMINLDDCGSQEEIDEAVMEVDLNDLAKNLADKEINLAKEYGLSDMDIEEIMEDLMERKEDEKLKASSKKMQEASESPTWPDSPEFEALTSEFVPPSGKAATEYGEIIRAINRIIYRYYNDGDMFYKGYGIETCGGDAIYLMDKSKESRKCGVRACLMEAWDAPTEDDYAIEINQMIDCFLSMPEEMAEDLKSHEPFIDSRSALYDDAKEKFGDPNEDYEDEDDDYYEEEEEDDYNDDEDEEAMKESTQRHILEASKKKSKMKESYLDPDIAGIKNFPPDQRQDFMDILQEWLGGRLNDEQACERLYSDGLCNESEAEEIMFSWNDNVEEDE